jgi:D-serine deaminase-like pyridoxal phosphate-dependent protein
MPLRLDDLDTPVLWVNLDTLESNIAYLAARLKSAGVNWRPHTKGIKIPAVAHKALAAGAIGITCAKLGEAEVMAAAGVRDILIANQIVGPLKTARLAGLRRHADVKVAVDSEANVRELGEAALARDVEIGVLVEVDIGMNRAGVQPGEPALALARLVHQTPGLRLRGLMGWEGHAAEITDAAKKRPVVEEALRRLMQTVDLCRAAGLPVDIVSCGGSVTYAVTAFTPGVTEIQGGGAMFGDAYYRDGGAGTTPGLFVTATVVSRPAPDRIILDAGFKSLPTWAGAPEPVGLPGVAEVLASAEHLSVSLRGPNAAVKVGGRLDFVVGYGDSTVFLHDQMVGVRNGLVEVVWAIQGRGRIQ